MTSRVRLSRVAAASAVLVLLAGCSGDAEEPTNGASSGTPQPSSTTSQSPSAPPTVEGTTFSSGGASLVLPDTWAEDDISIQGIHYILAPRPGTGQKHLQVAMTTILFSGDSLDKAEKVLTEDDEDGPWERLPDAEFEGRDTLVLETMDILDRRAVKYAVISDGALQIVTFTIADAPRSADDERTAAETDEFIAATMATWRVE